MCALCHKPLEQFKIPGAHPFGGKWIRPDAIGPDVIGGNHGRNDLLKIRPGEPESVIRTILRQSPALPEKERETATCTFDVMHAGRFILRSREVHMVTADSVSQVLSVHGW